MSRSRFGQLRVLAVAALVAMAGLFAGGAATQNIQTTNDVRVIDGDGLTGEAVVMLGSRLVRSWQGADHRQQRALLVPLAHDTVTLRLDIRF